MGHGVYHQHLPSLRMKKIYIYIDVAYMAKIRGGRINTILFFYFPLYSTFRHISSHPIASLQKERRNDCNFEGYGEDTLHENDSERLLTQKDHPFF